MTGDPLCPLPAVKTSWQFDDTPPEITVSVCGGELYLQREQVTMMDSTRQDWSEHWTVRCSNGHVLLLAIDETGEDQEPPFEERFLDVAFDALTKADYR